MHYAVLQSGALAMAGGTGGNKCFADTDLINTRNHGHKQQSKKFKQQNQRGSVV